MLKNDEVESPTFGENFFKSRSEVQNLDFILKCNIFENIQDIKKIFNCTKYLYIMSRLI